MEWHERVVSDPSLFKGAPYIKGTSVMVWQIVDLVAQGDPPHEVVKAFPGLQPADVNIALSYAAEKSKEQLAPQTEFAQRL